MSVFDIALVLSTLFCSIVAGLLFAYAVVVMPGIKNFDDKQFIQTFQITDRVIQDNQPVFIFVWLGSIISLTACAFFGFQELQGFDFVLLLLATTGYIIGVQLPTFVVHLPLNNQLQTLNVENMREAELNTARGAFETRWNRSNEIRAVFACCVSLLLIVVALKQ